MPSNRNTRSKRRATTSVADQPPSRRPRRSRSSEPATATALANSDPSAASTSTPPAVAPVNFATPRSTISPELLQEIESTSQPELSGDVVEAPVTVTPAATLSVPQLVVAAAVEQVLENAHLAITAQNAMALESFSEMAKAVVKFALDVSLKASLKFIESPQGGAILLHITTKLCQYVGYVGLGIGVTTLAGLLAKRLLRPLMEDAIVEGAGGRRYDQDRPVITPTDSLHVLLHCLTDKRFHEVLEDYKSGGLKERLQKEFSEVGIKVEGLKIEIENMEEVEKTKADIMKRSSEMKAQGEAETALPSKTDSPVTDEKKWSTGNDQGFPMGHSEEHGNWLTVCELMYSIRKPVSIYVDEIVKAFHKQLYEVDLLSAGKCSSPDDCIKKTTGSDLCKSCQRWLEKLEASHENGNNPSWHENCNSAKWSENHWEVAKFFMPALSHSSVKDAESTDLSSQLNVLEFMKDNAFLGKARVNVKLVRKLRSHVKNVWVHGPEQEFTDDEKEKIFLAATKFLEDLEKVCSNTENTKCLELLKRLKTSRFIVQTNN